MINNKKARYPVEFKESAVKLALESDKPASLTAKELGINIDTMYTWIKQYSDAKRPESPKTKLSSREMNYHVEEIKQLKKELARVTQERDILKKATAYFAKEAK